MITIYKYELCDESVVLELPIDSDILYVAGQRGIICLWVRINKDKAVIKRKFHLVGTCHKMPPEAEYHWEHIGTVIFMGDLLVWHVFEDLLYHGEHEQ